MTLPADADADARIDISRAQPADAQALTEASIRAFHDDGRRFRGVVDERDLGGPPGYDSPEWQRGMMGRGHYYTIRVDGRIVGGMIAFHIRGGSWNLGRIWIDPDRQGRGVGRAAIELLHAAHPAARRWTLETPCWAVRNHHLYESLGYVKVGEGRNPDGFTEYLYKREAGDSHSRIGDPK